MNQTAGYVKAKTEKPKNQKHNENRPKHVDLLRSFSRLVVAEASAPETYLAFTFTFTLGRPVRAISRIPGKTASTAM
jgi:hypothetical protein